MSGKEMLAARKLHGRGRLTIPKEIREYLNIEDGDLVCFYKDYNGVITIEKAPSSEKRDTKKYRVTK